MAERRKITQLKSPVSSIASRIKTVMPLGEAPAIPIERLRGQAGVDRRARWLMHQPLCVACELEGRVTAGQQVDHITPLAQGGADDDTNLQTLCIPCHQLKTALETGHMAAHSFPEWLPPALGALTIVCGPPGSGKSTYIDEHRAPADIVIDLDAIRAELSGQPIYHAADEDWRNVALRERNRRLGRLARHDGPSWFAVTGTGKREREWWQSHLCPASMIVLAVPLDVCIERINADARRPAHVKARHIAAARKWFNASV